jgi:hypothetical protein
VRSCRPLGEALVPEGFLNHFYWLLAAEMLGALERLKRDTSRYTYLSVGMHI